MNGARMATKRWYQAKDVPLLRSPIGAAGVNASRTTYFAIRTPSARLNTKISFFYWHSLTGQAAGALPTQNAGLSVAFSLSGQLNANYLNLYAAEQAETGWLIPTTDIVGTLYTLAGQSVPIQWAANLLSGIAGFSVDITGGQEWVGGVFQAGGCPAGYANQPGVNLSMRVRWENAVGAEICPDEWADLQSQMSIQAPEPVIYT